MELPLNPLFFALGSTFSFALASVIFTDFSKKHSAVWMNLVKAAWAFMAFSITLVFLNIWTPIDWLTAGSLMSSGLIGLMIGDLFLLTALTQIGPARTLMLFGFQPIILGVAGFFLYGQSFALYRLTAIIFLILCLITFSFESYKKSGKWEIRGLLIAMVAVILDSIGILITKWSYTQAPDLSPFQVNWIRCAGALIGFGVYHFLVSPIHLIRDLKKESQINLFKVSIASLAGTYLSLSLYLTAVKYGHLASVSAVGITSPLFATLFECLRTRQRPSLYLFMGLIFFICGFSILVVL